MWLEWASFNHLSPPDASELINSSSILLLHSSMEENILSINDGILCELSKWKIINYSIYLFIFYAYIHLEFAALCIQC